MDALHNTYLDSPVGLIEITGNEDGITAVTFINQAEGIDTSAAVHPSLLECRRQLEEYFAGERKEFTCDLNPKGTGFQEKVWEELLKIPFGKTVSYLNIAERIADKFVTRAVGSANGSNRIAIIIPCHRVIGSNGKLTGYAGELWRKEWLLKHEREIVFGKQEALF
jgi:methylated-DNA-[protein]-cysteine S-methyltransferase